MNNSIKNKIYSIVKDIPCGKVTSYGRIAKILGIKDTRLVGCLPALPRREQAGMLHQNKSKEVPCHRVIKSDGSLAKGYAFGGEDEQRKMLEDEGVKFTRGGKLESGKFWNDMAT